jgi:glutaminyl-peptide cyclotransferase
VRERESVRVRRRGARGARVPTVLSAAALTCLLIGCSTDANGPALSNPPSNPDTLASSSPSSNPGTVAPSNPSSGTLAESNPPSNPSTVAPQDPRTLAPSNPPTVVAFDSSRAYEHLRRQVGFGPRPAGSAALMRCRQYILAELEAAGIEAREDAFDAVTPLGRVRMVNVIGTIPGRRAERIALATHYDTKLFREFRFVGASDAASSTAAVLELARVLKSRQNEFTIELLFFDGEEAVVDWYQNNDNTYGSRRYVETARESGTLADLEALLLLDMIGDRDLTIRRDSNSTRWLTDIIWTSAAKLGYQTNFLSEETTLRSTSSISTIPPGIRRKTTSIT